MNAELVRVGDTIIGKDGSPMKVLDVEHVYEWDGPGMNLRQILITLNTELAMEWQPIETAPRDGTLVNVWLGEADAEDVAFYCIPGTRLSTGWTWRQGKLRPAMGMWMPVVTVRPTHWMPLPDPPKDTP